MASLLRRPSNLARYSKYVAECAAYTRHPPTRVRTTTQPYVPASFVNATRARRTYATSNQGDPEPPKDGKDAPAAKDSNKTPDSGGKQDSSNGASHLPEKSNNKNKEEGSGGDVGGKEGGGEPEKNSSSPPSSSKYALNEEEIAEVDQFGKWLKGHLPPSQAEQVDEPLERMKREGIPDDVKDFMQNMQKSKTPSLSSLVKFVREFTKHAWESTAPEEEGESKKEKPEEKRDSSGEKSEGAKKESSEDSKSDPEQEKQEQQQKRKRKQGSRGDEKKDSQFPAAAPKIDTPTLLISAILTYYTYRSVFPGESEKDITWQEFRTTFFDKGLVEKLTVFDRSRVRVELRRDALASVYPDSPAIQPNFFYYFTIGSVDAFERSLDEAHKELGVPSSERIPVSYQESTPWLPTLLSLGPTLLGLGFLYALSRRGGGGAGGQGGIFGIGKSRAKKFNHETDVKVKFSDVAGMDEAKLEIMEFVSFLKKPEQFQRLGAKIPRGAILSGAPGTGKTLLAKATAGESEVPFYSVSGSEFVEMFVGVGPSRVRDLFQTARKNTPCILFIDEIDAIGRSRAKQNFGGGNDERENTLNQILTEMDGFNTSDQVVVLAGTNRPDVLDHALLRPGRFDRHITIDRPTMEGRKQIFAVHLKKIVIEEDTEYLKGRLSALTPGFSGADIANCVNEAALVAARFKADKVAMKHFEMAIERVIGGLEKKSVVLAPHEKRTVAYHEAGHAICGWFLKHADPLLKVSIIPRGQGALGYAQYLPAHGDTYLMSLHQLMDRMAMTLGGRVSEELHFDTVTSGASDDFNKVTRMATAMVTKFGMSAKIGHVYFDEEQAQFQKPFSEQTARDVDLEVRRIVDEAYKQCHELLEDKKHEIGLIAEELLSKEMLSRDDLVRLLGPRPHPESSEFTKYFDGQQEGETIAPPPNSSESVDDKGSSSSDGPQPPTPAA